MKTEAQTQTQHVVESLASQAAITITNQQLIQERQLLIERFIEVIAGAFDGKSPYTVHHSRRVPPIWDTSHAFPLIKYRNAPIPWM